MRAVYTVLLNELHRGLGEELLDKDLGADPGAENDSGGVPGIHGVCFGSPSPTTLLVHSGSRGTE